MKLMTCNNRLIFFFSIIMILCCNLFAELEIDIAVPDDSDNNSVENNSNENEDKAKKDIVQFINKDRLHGTMLSVITDSGLQWKTLEAMDNITFKTDNIKEILLGHNTFSLKQTSSQVLLTNDDMIAGKLVKLTEKELILDTDYAGTLTVGRHMIKSIYPSSSAFGATFRGPNSIEEWTQPKNANRNAQVSITDGELNINGYTAAGRDMKLPDLSKIEFELETLGNCQLQIQVYGDKVDRHPRNGYVLYLSSGYIYMQRYGDGSSDNLGNFRAKQIQNGKGKITLLANKKEKKFTLLINDNMAKEWTDTSWAGTGGFVTFISQSNTTSKIKNIIVGKWSGKVPGKKDSSADTVKDSIEFINDDIISGTLKSIVDDKVIFKTEYAEMNIPIERVKEIITATDSRHRARRRANDIQCVFESGDYVTLTLGQIKNNTVEGESGNLGKVKMKLAAFRKIKFNIYDE